MRCLDSCFTFRPLRKGQAQPAHGHAALAADGGGAAAEGVEWYGSNYQGQVQGQIHSARDVHIHREGILHTDDPTLQNGRGHRGDLQHLAVPHLGFAGW